VVYSVSDKHKSSSYSAWDCDKSGQSERAASPNQPDSRANFVYSKHTVSICQQKCLLSNAGLDIFKLHEE
jgi:hypothetical protein